MKKKLLAGILGFALILSLFPVGALATGGNGGFDIRDGVLWFHDGPEGDVVIPQGITEIKQYAFTRSKGITSVTIPGSVKIIDDFAFQGCVNLISVAFQEGVEEIGGAAFSGTAITTLTIPSSVKRIGNEAFRGCKELTSVTITGSNTEICGAAFSDCTNLINVSYPEDIKRIGGSAFENTPYWAQKGPFVIHNGVLVAYLGTDTNVIIPEGIREIGERAFAGRKDIAHITLPETVTRIGDSAFSSCTGLTDFSIPAGVTELGEGAFYGCKGLSKLELPAGLTRIGERAFSSCTGLTSMDIPTGLREIPKSCFSYCENLLHVTIPDSVETIGESAFSGCRRLPSITIPDSVKKLDSYAFYGCTSLEEITFPSGLTDFGVIGVFWDTPWKAAQGDFVIVNGVLLHYLGEEENVVIPPEVTVVGPASFQGNKVLIGVTIHENVTKIGRCAFLDCQNLSSITFLPGKLREIEGNAFAACYQLASVTLPDTLTTLGPEAFTQCIRLASIDLPLGLTEIPNDVFYSCGSLNDLVIPTGVTKIGSHAFSSCLGLTSLTIPSTVTEIDEYAFVTGGIVSERGVEAVTAMTKEYYKTLTIHGAPGSRAQSFARENGIAFVGDQPTETPQIAYASTQEVLVDGEKVTFQCYALRDGNGNLTNYIKLRDLAIMVNGTPAQFNVEWNGAVSIATGTAYQAVGGELSTPYSGNRRCQSSGAPTLVNGQTKALEAFSIQSDQGGGYTYYKLRDLGAAIGFDVIWSPETGIAIHTDRPYSG